MGSRDEAGMYSRVDNLRVAEVTADWLTRPNKLYRPDRVNRDPGVVYSFPKGKYKSIEAALAAIRRSYN